MSCIDNWFNDIWPACNAVNAAWMLPPTSEGLGDSVPDKLLEVSLLVVVEITGGLTGCKKKYSVSEIINQSNLVPTIILEPFFILFANCSFFLKKG